MDSRDPVPIDINADFDKAVVTLMKMLAADQPAVPHPVSRSQQERLLRIALTKDPLLLAFLEQPEWQFSVRQATVPLSKDQHDNVTKEVGPTVKPGDIINLSYYGFPHKVVVEHCEFNPQTNMLSLKAIHYGREGLTYPITVMREDFKLACNGSDMWLHKFPDSACYQPTETLARARSRLGEQQQNPYWNNASTMALWCRVRDHHQNKDDLKVPLFSDNNQVLHELKPGDHVLVPRLTSQLHAVLTSVKVLGGDANLLSAVALTEELRKLGMRAFKTGVMALKTDRRPVVIEVNFPVEVVRQNAKKYAGVSLCWDCNWRQSGQLELQAIAFLASGSTSVNQISAGQFTIDVSEIRAGHAIWQDSQFHFVLAVHRPQRSDQTYSIETVQYAPLQLTDAPKTVELRLLVSLSDKKQVQLLRHNEPDVTCPILRSWKFEDSPQVKETLVDQTKLQPGDSVCIRRDTTAYPHVQEMPGLHAIVKSIDEARSVVEVVCYTGEAAPTVGVREFSSQAYKFSQLRYEVSPNQLASKAEALQRALSRLGTGQYCVSWSNSRDLARWCSVNHKANAPKYLRPVLSAEDLASLQPDGCQLRLLHLDGNNSASKIQVVHITSSERVSERTLKLRLSDVGWKPSVAQKVSIDDINGLSRVRHTDSVNESATQRRQEMIASLLNASLVDVTDGKLGHGVTSKSFCAWLRTGQGLANLSALMSATPALPSSLECDPVTDLNSLQPWDHVVYDTPLGNQHLLVVQVEPNAGSLCAYTYGPVADGPTASSRELTAFVHFPADKQPYLMHTIVNRHSTEAQAYLDASSDLSSALSAASSYPYNAAAWIQMTLLELESDLLMPQCCLTSLLKSLLKFAFRFAAERTSNDGRLEACRLMLESPKFAEKLNCAFSDRTKKHRLLLITRVIASLIGADTFDAPG